jgi:NAD-dependent dihydropyrimidine dehydrogenase PreA subunit
MACVTVCPTQAIKVDEANLDIHKKTAETAIT